MNGLKNRIKLPKIIAPTLLLVLLFLTGVPYSFSQVRSEPFEFQFEGKTLKGLIEQPDDQQAKALIIIIPGYGKTDFVAGRWFLQLRRKLVASGLSVCLWDKMGCGESEGTFNIDQAVENSAEEAIAAIHKIKQLKVPGHQKIGCWGISRAGWICPLINNVFPIKFWISVSGTDDKENYGYLIKSNLIIVGKSDQEVEKLHNAWRLGHRLYCTETNNYEAVLKAIQPLREDSICRKLFGYTKPGEITEEGRKDYAERQQLYTSKGEFDEQSGLWKYIENFDELLSNINCPVLAVFGENDSQVDWRKTKQLYETTIGLNTKANLTIKTFDQCNHNLQKCITCGYQEDLSALNWQACDHYFDTIERWLKDQKIVE